LANVGHPSIPFNFREGDWGQPSFLLIPFSFCVIGPTLRFLRRVGFRL
jgi:hypothetical protein